MGVRGDVTDEQVHDLRAIRRSAANLIRAVNDALFGRPTADGVRVELENVEVDEMLHSATRLVAPDVRAKRLFYVHERNDPLISARADRRLFQQIVLDLLFNAVQYTPSGGHITLACEAREGRVHVHVSDTGHGIAPERLEQIFEPSTEERPAAKRSHGLGLARCRQLARLMGGDVTVVSEVDKGSTFTLALPDGDRPVALPPDAYQPRPPILD
jgi:signal transduction histidine kinase